MRQHRLLFFLIVPLFVQSCAVGYNSTLFMTKSNIGLDVDTKPPTLEISIARREAVIAPGFEGGQTPPVLASFRTDSNPFSRFFFGVQSTFAGGNAAVAIAQTSIDPKTEPSSLLCLSKKPNPKQILGVDVSVSEPGAVEPFFFGTDTSFGLKVAWSGMTGQIPDTVRLGFSRKEFAWAPVFGTDQVTCKIPGTTLDGKYGIWMPPFVAVIDNDVQTGSPAQTGVKWLQYFATGTSATRMASRDEIRSVMLERIDPEAASRLKSFRDNQSQQIASFNNIKAIYQKSNEDSKAKILQKAKDLKLVGSDVTVGKFTDALAVEVDPSNSGVTTSLETLESFVKTVN